MKEKSVEVDRQVSNVMGEVQRLEAKHSNLDHMMGRIEDDAKKIEKSKERHEKQAKQIEEDVPSMETDITSLGTQIVRLEEELGTELTSTLTDDEQTLLDELKATQTRLDGEIEEHTSVVEDATIKWRRLTSLLEDNLIVRRNELTEATSNSRKGARNSTDKTASQAQVKEELEQKRRELEEATATAEDIEKQYAEVKETDENLRAEILKIKNNFDKLKTQDAAYQKELEECHESQERLLNRVRVWCDVFVGHLLLLHTSC
jgi:chromosome segregation ATPase